MIDLIERYVDEIIIDYDTSKHQRDKVGINMQQARLCVMKRTLEVWRNYEIYRYGVERNPERRITSLSLQRIINKCRMEK